MFSNWIRHPAFPLIAPFALFMLLLSVEGLHPSAVYLVYPLKTLAVGILILWLLRRMPSFNPKRLWIGAATGVGVFLLWVGLGPFLLLGEPGDGFQPYLFENKDIALGLIVFRILGASLVVPVMEELFWRGFLMRYLIKDRFEDVPIGTYQPFSFWVTTLLFASVHGVFAPVAFLTGILYGLLFVKTRSLGNIILAHGITNFLLGLYVLKTGKWYFW